MNKNISLSVFNASLARLGTFSLSLSINIQTRKAYKSGKLSIPNADFSITEILKGKGNTCLFFMINLEEITMPAICELSDNVITLNILTEKIEYILDLQSYQSLILFIESLNLDFSQFTIDEYLRWPVEKFFEDDDKLAKRSPTNGEILLAKSYYLNSVDYTKIKIRKKNPITWFMKHGAMVIGRNMHVAKNYYRDDYSYGLKDLESLFIHEICHIWQLENSNYWWFKALIEHIKYGSRVYDYDMSNLKEKLTDYRFEQQGKIMADYTFVKSTPLWKET